MEVLEHEHPLELVDLQPPKIVDVWEEESDDDDDDLIIEEEFRRPCNRCYQDITVYHRYYYKCTLGSCDILLHKFCAELPQMLNHTSHTHTLYPLIHGRNWECHYCQSQHKNGEIGYSCLEELCYYNIDVNCVIDVENKSIHHPSHPHKLVCTISTPILCHCKACGREHKGVFYSCTTCFFTIHSDCAFLPKKMLIQKTTDDAFYHPHPLTISYSFPQAEQTAKYFPRCRVCNEFFYQKTNLWIYKCEKCIYYAHVDCATSRREPFMSILSSPGSGRLVKNYNDADYPDLLHLPFPDETDNILKHLFFKNNEPGTFETDDEVNLQHIKHQHQVILVDTECIDSKVGSTSSNINSFILHNPMKKIELLCNGCLRPIMSMPFYKCAQSCSFALHEWCTRLPTSIENHPGHLEHPLILLPNVPHKFFNLFRCEVCDLDCNGFAYGCVKCEYYVEVSCGFIPENITHKAHPNHLLSRVKLDTHRWCHICRRYMLKDYFSFSCSNCDNISIHPECALLLPGTIRHKYDKHPMILSYLPIENHKSEYFCEICEDPLNPHCSFYHCHNHKCVQSVHSACAPLILRSEMADRPSWYDNSIYKFVNVKFGSIHKTPGHPHPLSFTQGTESDGECNRCGRELRYKMIFKCLECKYAIDYRCCESLEQIMKLDLPTLEELAGYPRNAAAGIR